MNSYSMLDDILLTIASLKYKKSQLNGPDDEFEREAYQTLIDLKRTAFQKLALDEVFSCMTESFRKGTGTIKVGE